VLEIIRNFDRPKIPQDPMFPLQPVENPPPVDPAPIDPPTQDPPQDPPPQDPPPAE
jgi:hypothetical protein